MIHMCVDILEPIVYHLKNALLNLFQNLGIIYGIVLV